LRNPIGKPNANAILTKFLNTTTLGLDLLLQVGIIGHDEIRKYYDTSATRFPGLEVTVVSDFADGDVGAVEWDAILIDAEGTRYPLQGVNLITLRDGKFQEVRAYFDTSHLPKG